MWAYTGRVMDVSVTLENTCSAYIDARNATSVCLPFSLANYRPLCLSPLSASRSSFIETDLSFNFRARLHPGAHMSLISSFQRKRRAVSKIKGSSFYTVNVEQVETVWNDLEQVLARNPSNTVVQHWMALLCIARLHALLCSFICIYVTFSANTPAHLYLCIQFIRNNQIYIHCFDLFHPAPYIVRR